MINPKKKEYIDNKAEEVIKLIKSVSVDFTKKENEPRGNLAGAEVIDWTDKIVDAPHKISYTTYDGQTVGLVESYKGKNYGLEKEDFKQLKILVEQIYKEEKIQHIIGYNFVYRFVSEWIFENYRIPNGRGKLSEKLEEEIRSSIKTYNVYIPILYLDVVAPFQIGRVSFTYFTKEYLDKLEEQFKEHAPKVENPYPSLRKYFGGQVYAAITIRAESEKAKEIAFQECSLAIDCLRICSPVMGFPKMKSDFDLEKKSNVVIENNIMLQPTDEPFEFIMSKSRNANSYRVDTIEFENFKQMNLGAYHRFLLESKRTSEMDKIIINSIVSFSEALKDNLLQRRVSKIFTIYESLTLKNFEAGILDSLCKYGAKLMFTKIEDRKEIVRIFKNLYKVRSAYVHHSKYSKFEMEELKRLQIGLSIMLSNLIKLSKKYNTKDALIDAIDLQIDKSFDLENEMK